LSPLFQYLEQEVISDIARRISKTMKYTRTAENMAVSMYRKGYSPAYIRKEAMKKLNADKDFRKEVAKNTVEYKKEISKLIQKIENDAYKAGDKILAAAGDMAWYDDLAVWKQAGKLLTTSASTLSMLVDGIKKQTKGEMKNLTRSLGFKTQSGYAAIGNAYRNELDKAMIKLMSGTFSQEQVINDTVRSLARSGIKTVAYGNRADNLDVAVSRALRTGAHQIAGEIQNNNIKEMGENLVYVQEHAGARNTGVGVANHEEWQGKVYYIKPGTDYSEEAKRVGQQNIEDLWECTGYSVDNMHINDPAGLFGYNCRHLYNVWFEGISSLPAKQPVKPPVVWNGKVLDFYAQTQEARKQERNIRALKRERDALERTGQDTTEIKKKLSEAGRKYKQFCKVCKFPPNTTRTRYESGTADLTKTKAYREYNDTCNKIRESRKEVDKEKQIDYNEIKNYRNYEKSINVGELTPLADFELYKKISNEIDEKIVGITASNGIKIKNKSNHFIARVIGSVEQKRNGVEIEKIIDTLREPDEITNVEVRASGSTQRFKKYGMAAVSVNPETGNLIQVNPIKERWENDSN
jgi:hypothetical protein